MEGRQTSSRGFVRTADYIQTQLKEQGLQPVLLKEYRLQYASLQHYIESATVRLVGVDSLSLMRGTDFVVHQQEKKAEVQFSPRVQNLIESKPYQPQKNVQTASTVSSSSLHVAGYIPGRHPQKRDSLIILIAPVDGWGAQGSQTYSDGTDLAVSATSLLEVVRRISEVQQSWSAMAPSIMVAFVSGTKGTCDGPQAFLRTLPWAKRYISHLVVLNDVNPCEWSKIVAGEGITAKVHVLNDSQIQFPADNSTPFFPWIRRDRYLRTPYFDLLTNKTLHQAETAYQLVWDFQKRH